MSRLLWTRFSFNRLCMTVKDNSGNKYMLTAAHLWFEDDEYNEPCDAEGSDILGDLAYHALGEDDTLNFTGEVVDASFEGDTALFDDSEDEFEFENLIPNGGLNWGWHSEWSIDSMMCDETEVQKIGIATKKRSGIITDTHVEDTGDRSDCTTLHGPLLLRIAQ